VTGSIVSPELRARVRGAATPIATGFGRLGLTPNHLTLIGFGIAIVAAWAAAQQAWLASGLLVVFGGVFDLFDGTLARATGKATKLGAFMDSVFDRAGEAIVYLGIVAGLLESGWVGAPLFAGAAMGSAFMVSYVRAKSESLGFTVGSGMAAVGLAPREVRILILTVGLLGAGVLGTSIVSTCETCAGGAALPFGVLALEASLGLITLLATITTIQRILHVIDQSANKEHQ
jgi:phosphatidylglycerophosphate synthase